jgi:general secretion pathway protein B
MLTAEQKREWPALALGGSVWSETPSARFVILGGQVVREGDTTPDGVQVERITPKAVVLRWRDQRAALPL